MTIACECSGCLLSIDSVYEEATNSVVQVLTVRLTLEAVMRC
jgi:hypothetical protein